MPPLSCRSHLQTGQVTCHDVNGHEIECEGTGQDGEYRRGIPWPTPRFEVQGDDGWRLPNINELESLVDCSAHDPALPAAHPFMALQDVYWSSSTSLFEPDWAWALYLNKGAVGVGQKAHAHFYVWAVHD